MTNRSGRPLRSIPMVGQIVLRRGRKEGFLRYQAHAEALQGRRSAYRFTLFYYSYEVVVTPRRDRRRRIIGVQGTLNLDFSKGDDRVGLWLGTGPESRRLREMMRRRKKNSMSSAIRSLELARAVSDTVRVSAEVRHARLIAATHRALQAQHKAEFGELRARFVADASAILESSFDLRESCGQLGKLAVARMADWLVIQFRDNDCHRRITLESRDPHLAKLLEKVFPLEISNGEEPGLLEPGLLEPGLLEPGLLEPGLIGNVGRPLHELFADVTVEDLSKFVPAGPGLQAAQLLNIRSVIRTALVSHGRRIGYLTLGSNEPNRPFDLQDLRTMRELAGRIAMTRENLLLFEEAQKEIAMRKEIEARMRVLNAELERRVSERTSLLEEAMRESNSFAYTVAHDLRAPLRAMTGFCQAVKEDYSDTIDPEGKDYLDRIVTAARRMDNLIRDLLDYSRINRAEIRRTFVDLDPLVDEALGLMAVELKDRNADIRVAKPLGRVFGHGPVLAQILTNLISNATKFVAPGVVPVVHVRSETRDHQTRILIQDNGIGIAPEHQERIFGIFERLNRAEDYSGTGIGLAIVRRAMERLGGRVGLESKPGRGSTFWIELPSA